MNIARYLYILIVALVILPAFLISGLSGCATPGECLKRVVGVSTSDVEAARKDAASKTIALDAPAAYDKVKEILKSTPAISIYAEDRKNGLIAAYYVDVNTTPVGVFISEEAKGRAKIEVSSPSPNARKYLAKSLFPKL